MFRETQLSISSDPLVDSETDELLDIRAILEACTELPAAVAGADFTCVDERVIDVEILETLAGESAYVTGSSDWLDRRKRRKNALSQYIDQVLVCVFIRLPGIHYTIEIDPKLARVAHCEWQEI
jgi:hypothetical protein